MPSEAVALVDDRSITKYAQINNNNSLCESSILLLLGICTPAVTCRGSYLAISEQVGARIAQQILKHLSKSLQRSTYYYLLQPSFELRLCLQTIRIGSGCTIGVAVVGNVRMTVGMFTDV